MKLRAIAILLVIMMVALSGRANPRFQHFSIKDGLSNNAVRLVFQDKDGFLWIGTLNGLNRFDGTHFKEYHYQPGDTLSLKNNRIMNIMQDSRGIFYLMTFDGAIHRFDAQAETFQEVKAKTPLKNEVFHSLYTKQSSPDVFWFVSSNNGCARLISNPKFAQGLKVDHFSQDNYLGGDTVSFVYPSQSGEVWIGASNGLVYLKNDTVDISAATVSSYFSGVNGFGFLTAVEDENSLWFGTKGRGVIVYNKKTKQFSEDQLPQLAHETVNAIWVHRDKIVIGTQRSGLIVYSLINHSITTLNTQNSALNSNCVQSFFYDQNNLLWIVTNQRGVTSYDITSGQLVHHPLNTSQRASLGEQDKHIFYRDSNGDLWIGIYGGGLCKYNRSLHSFEQYQYDSRDPYSLSSDYLLSVFEDRSKNLWIGTFNGGMNKLSLEQPFFRTLKPDEGGANTLNLEVRAIVEEPQGSILVGTKGGGVHRIPGTESTGISSEIIPLALPRLKKGIYCLFEDRGNNLWIGTKGDGFFVIKAADRRSSNPPMKQFKQMGSSELEVESNNVFSIVQDSYSNYWIATYSGGLYRLSDPLGKAAFTHFVFDKNDSCSLIGNRLRYLMFDRQNNLWIATSDGVNLLPVDQLMSSHPKFIRIQNKYDNKPVISNNDVLYIMQHSNGAIFMGTFGGGLNILQSFDLKNQHFEWKYVMKNQGLSSNVISSMVEDDNGKVWLATDNGINMYDPHNEQVELFFESDGLGTDIFSDGTCLKTAQGHILFGNSKGVVIFDPLTLKKDTTRYNVFITSIKVNNGVLNGCNTAKRQSFNYKQNAVSFEFASLDYKAPEKIYYSFFLENFDQDWSVSSRQKEVTYLGLPPGKYNFRVRATNSDGVWMPEAPAFAFEISPPFWNSTLAYLFYSIVVLLLIWGYYKLKLRQVKLQHELRYNEDLNEQKLKYYTNISHEFKTPLTLILNPIEDIIDSQCVDDDVRRKALGIKKNARYLLHLVEQILDFRRLRENKANLHLKNIQFSDFFEEIFQAFLPLAQKKQVVLQYHCNAPDYSGCADPGFLEKICYNLLSNAIKHTPSGNQVKFLIEIDAQLHILKLTVADEGVGIAREELDKIFNRFYDSQDSSGIGLFFTSELVTWHGGTITADSTLGQGSVFSVTLNVASQVGISALSKAAQSSMLNNSDDLELKYYPELSDETIPESKKLSSRKNTLLLIEDNPNLLAFLMDKLGETYNVVGAENGKVGLEKIRSVVVDLVVCDYMMPEMDGLSTLKRLKSDINTSHIPVILLTAIANNEKMVEAMELGADDYIAKPFNISLLLVRIENLISQRKKLKQVFGQEPDFSFADLPGANADKTFIEQVTKQVEENIGNVDFSVDLIAEKLSMSRTIFYKRMKQVSGYAPNEFIQLIRMKKAAYLIKHSNLPVSEVGLLVGFTDSNYFSKCFKNHFGMPPSVYQKQD